MSKGRPRSLLCTSMVGSLLDMAGEGSNAAGMCSMDSDLHGLSSPSGISSVSLADFSTTGRSLGPQRATSSNLPRAFAREECSAPISATTQSAPGSALAVMTANATASDLVLSGASATTAVGMDALAMAIAKASPAQAPARLSHDAKRRLEEAKKLALEIEATVSTNKSVQTQASSDKPVQKYMGVCIHWSGRGFGILRCRSHGEVFCHVKALANCSELVLGDVVTFEMGFDRRKQKPEAINCFKAGVGAYKAPPSAAGGRDERLALPPSDMLANSPAETGDDSGTLSLSSAPPKIDDSALAGAAAAAALKLLSQGGAEVPSRSRSASRSRSRRGRHCERSYVSDRRLRRCRSR